MNKFVEIPRETICAAFEAAGFEQVRDGGEVAYERRVPDSRMRVLVLTSVPWNGGATRDRGADAIRVMGLEEYGAENKSRKIFGKKILRVNGAQATVDRTIQAARDAWKELVYKRDVERMRHWAYTKPGLALTWLTQNHGHKFYGVVDAEVSKAARQTSAGRARSSQTRAGAAACR